MLFAFNSSAALSSWLQKAFDLDPENADIISFRNSAFRLEDELRTYLLAQEVVR